MVQFIKCTIYTYLYNECSLYTCLISVVCTLNGISVTFTLNIPPVYILYIFEYILGDVPYASYKCTTQNTSYKYAPYFLYPHIFICVLSFLYNYIYIYSITHNFIYVNMFTILDHKKFIIYVHNQLHIYKVCTLLEQTNYISCGIYHVYINIKKSIYIKIYIHTFPFEPPLIHYCIVVDFQNKTNNFPKPRYSLLLRIRIYNLLYFSSHF